MYNLHQWISFASRLKLSPSIIEPQLRNLSQNFNKNNEVINKPVWIKPLCIKHYCKPSDYGRQLGGYEYKEEIEDFKSLWRKPLLEKGFWKSKLAVFGSKKFAGNLLKYNPANFKYRDVAVNRRTKVLDYLKFEQQFKKERLSILGCDLAAAHFVVFRGGAVKFYNHSDWIRDTKKSSDYDDNLPNSYDPEYILEAIDLSGTKIVYEGLKNIEHLEGLKWLSFAGSPHCDNWVLDKVSGEFGESLEYLDLSFTSISVHGLGALYRFKQLKTLKLHGFADIPEFIPVCDELKHTFPGLSIEGITVEDSEMADDTLNSALSKS